MARHFRSRMNSRLLCVLLGFWCLSCVPLRTATAKDYFLTIGGGYAPEGNQASMEANVLFFREVLQQTHASSPYEHRVFFADGSDPSPDLQCTASLPYSELIPPELTTILGWKFSPIEYRDHQITQVDGRNNPKDVERGFDEVLQETLPGDRLFVYVTAHGGASKTDNPHDTKIYGWDRQSVSASTVSRWLAKVPEQVPVIMVMAQCYCGGFAHAIFEDASQDRGLASGLRIGFFAQQHNLPAAGCRPDISNDEEYSSYFWGAILGRSRNGKPIEGVDRNLDGQVSLAEAHLYAVIASPTIDIPLRASDALLRAFSHLGDTTDDAKADSEEAAVSDDPSVGDSSHEDLEVSSFVTMEHTIESLLQNAESTHREIALHFIKALDVDPALPASSVQQMIRSNQRDGLNRRRQGRSSGKAHKDLAEKLKTQMMEQWPELVKVENPQDIDSLQIPLSSICEEIVQWPDFAAFSDLERERLESRKRSQANELKRVQYSRLLHTLESLVLAENLTRIADEAIIERYRAMLALEQSTLAPSTIELTLR